MTPAQEWQIRKDGGAPVGRKRKPEVPKEPRYTKDQEAMDEAYVRHICGGVE